MSQLNYDTIAESYGDDWAGLRASSREMVVSQVAGLLPVITSSLDCAIGHGEFWQELSQRSEVVGCVGNDLSEEMLVAASRKLSATEFRGVAGDALTLPQRLEGQRFELVVSHLLYDYCAIGAFIPRLKGLLMEGGILSSLTTVKSQYDTQFWEQIEARPLLRRIGNIDESIRRGGTPESHEDHLEELKRAGLSIVAEEELVVPVAVYSSDDIWSAAYHSGWGLGGLSKLGGPRRWLLRQALRLTDLPGSGLYPFQMNVRFSCVCARA